MSDDNITSLADVRIRAAILGGKVPVVGARRADDVELGAVHLNVNGNEIDIPSAAWCQMVADVSDAGTTEASLAIATMLHTGRPDLVVEIDGEALMRVALRRVAAMGTDADGDLVASAVRDTPDGVPPGAPIAGL